MRATIARLAPAGGALQSAEPGSQRKTPRRSLINLTRTCIIVGNIGLVIVIALYWGRWIAGLTDRGTDNAHLRADTTLISTQVKGRFVVPITEDVALREIPWIASLVDIVRTVGWQSIGTLSQILSSRFLEADVAARAVAALIARTLQREAFVLASVFPLLGVVVLMSTLATLSFRKTCPPEGCSNSLVKTGPSMPIRTLSIVDDGRRRPITAEVLQGE
jgi:hypothetical protein